MLLKTIIFSCAIFCIECEPTYVFNGENYTRESVLTIKGLPTNLAYNPNGDELLFTLIDLDTLQDDNVQTRMDQYILRNGEAVKIDNVNGQAAVVDERNNVVYIATDSGVERVERDERSQLREPEEPGHNAAVQAEEQGRRLRHILPGIRRQRRRPGAERVQQNRRHTPARFQEPVEYVGLAKNSAKALALDARSRIVLAANDGLYRLSPDNVIPSKLMDLEYTPSGIVFAGDDMGFQMHSMNSYKNKQLSDYGAATARRSRLGFEPEGKGSIPTVAELTDPFLTRVNGNRTPRASENTLSRRSRRYGIGDYSL
ncbi:hypothetical protein EVAR_46397_1 [Eumeta japonica]|uniref:Uncharacterized protein n=1 Tax=Eumeta variegata TaxID=151549 RepID=A0A4C1WW34_EUMVA|nr:hypothetical protein EVAR_46397_1 [Eumeta japonica]